MSVGQLLTRNIALTAGMLVACLILASIIGPFAAHATYPEGASAARGGTMMKMELQEARSRIRDRCVSYAPWIALAVSQSVFLVWHLAPPARTPSGPAAATTAAGPRPTGEA